MSIEELLKPRYKVIAHYPLSPYKIGDIITKPDIKESVHLLTVPNRDDFGDKLDEQHFYDISDLQLYPVLFQPLQWYEDRKLEEMPEYLKIVMGHKHELGHVFKVDKYEEYYVDDAEIPHESFLAYGETIKDCIGMIWCSPATLTEYENYKQSKQCNS